MSPNTICQILSAYGEIPADARGQWYVASDLLDDEELEELNIQESTGAMVLATRKGTGDGQSLREDLELFLCGTDEQLAAAQETFKLLPEADALLDSPESYWG